MSRFFINLSLILFTYLAYGQSKPIDLNPKDTVEYKQSYGISLGLDLSRIITSSLADNYSGFEIVADYRLTQNLYIAAELGNEEKTRQEDLFNFTTSGSYLKVQKEDDRFPNLWIPGFNKVTDDSRFGVGYNYSISYFLPLYKKKNKVKKKIDQAENEVEEL